MSDYIAHDLLDLILKRLPVKTLLRCRCVCKSWKQLIASDSFISDHLALQTPRRIITQEEVFDSLTFDPQHTALLERMRLPDDKHRLRHFAAVSSVHGVLCLYDYGATDRLFLWNPSIRQIVRFPLPEFPSYQLVNKFKYCGFWIDPLSYEFKIVIFCLEAEIAALFSSRKQLWTEVNYGVGKWHSKDDSTQVLIDGVAHWIAYPYWDYGAIITFDFGRDEFGTIDLPEVLRDREYFGVNVCKWHGVLSVIRYATFSSLECDLWAMQNGSWSRMFSCKLPERFYNAFCVLESCGRVLASTCEDPQLLLYDPKDGSTVVESEIIMINQSSFVYDFVESLVFPDRKCIPVIDML